MNWLNDTLSSEVASRLGWTLIHSLWQGVLVAACLVALLALIPKRRAQCRYLLSCLALAAVLGGLVATFWLVPGTSAINPLSASKAPTVSAAVTEPIPLSVNPVAPMEVVETVDSRTQALAPSGSTEPTSRSLRDRLSGFFHPWIAWIVPVWLIGVIGLSIWRLGGWIALQRLRSLGTKPVSPDVKATLNALVRKLGLKRSVEILQSAVVKTPMAMGLVKPLILLPVSVLAGLTPAQLEVILTHELAHIRRHDYLVNMFQTVAETLLFHHPAVWWISRSIRQEREYCCDDVVLSLTVDRVNYAEALASLAKIDQGSSRLSVAAGGGSLADRIQRIFGLSGEGRLTTTTWLPGFFFMILLGAAAVSMVSANAHTDTVKELESPGRFRGRVSDARTGQPVAHFRVLPGIDWDTFKGRQVFGWLEDEERAFEMGHFDYTFKKKYPVYRIGIRASGYLPAYSASFPHERGNQRLTLELEPLPQPGGVVLRPDGTPASGAVVTLVLPGSRVDFLNGTFSGPMDWRRHNEPMGGEVSKITADVRGAFAFPDRTDPYLIVVEHEAGWATISAKDLVKSSTCALRPWARLEARLYVLGKLAVNRSFGIISRPRSYDVMLRSENVYTADMVLGDDHDLKTDGSGRVVVDRLVPGEYRVLWEANWTMHSADSPIVLESGKTLVVDLGKARRSVVGRLKADPKTALSVNGRNVIVSVEPFPWFYSSLWKPKDRDLREQVTADHKAFLESEEGKQYQRTLHGIEADGTFRIKDLPPGDYVLNVKVYSAPVQTDSPPPEKVVDSLTTPHSVLTEGFRLDVEPVIYENNRAGPTSNAKPLDLGALVVQPVKELDASKEPTQDTPARRGSKAASDATLGKINGLILTARVVERKKDGVTELQVDTSLPVKVKTRAEVHFPVEFAGKTYYGGRPIYFTVAHMADGAVRAELESIGGLPILNGKRKRIDELEIGEQARVPLTTAEGSRSPFQLQYSYSLSSGTEIKAEETGGSWGPEVNGVSMRVCSQELAVSKGKVPRVLVDIRNLESIDRSIAIEHESWELEINGRWRKTNVFRSGERRYLPLKSGQVQREVEVWLSANLQEELQNLAEGRHKLRLARILNSALQGKIKDRIRVVSSPFEIHRH